MALDKEDIRALVEALRAPDARSLAEVEARVAKHNKKRALLKAETKKNETHAFYRAKVRSYVSGVGLIEPGQVVSLPLEPVKVDDDGTEIFMEPSHTWERVKTQKEISAAAEAEAEAEAKANELAKEEFEAATAKKGAVKGAKKSGKSRASDQDVA